MKIKKLCKKRGISQAELGRRLKVSRSAVSIAAKKGIKTVSVAKRYAEALGCDWRELLD